MYIIYIVRKLHGKIDLYLYNSVKFPQYLFLDNEI